MQALEDYLPRPGLSTPIITVLDREGRVLEDEQRAVVRFVVQDGRGADIVFAAGTTGEWDRIDNPRRQAVMRIAVDECRRVSARVGRKIEAWAGITAHTRAETAANLDYAIDLEADAAVVAPLSIHDAGAPPEFVERELGAVFERRGKAIPLFLYDNADIAAPGKSAHLHTRDVKRMARLAYVRGIKVTAGKAVLGNYTRAASHFKLSHEFAVYAGVPYLIFDLFAPAGGISGTLRHRWNRYLTQRAMPYGVVSGASNVMPREWQRAWRVCRAGNPELMRRYAEATGQLRAACEFKRSGKPYSPVIACYKAALHELGVIESDAVAQGTPALESAERREFAARVRAMRRHAAETLEPGWVSEPDPRRGLKETPRAVRPHA
ncbi:MAG TPA: dihydrodipicolinate synthase family protein [Candidatus Binataceae bacterium]|nr:dihydrodipicolinate synthase family protein [Candidatus Binataceae bacterium]